MSGHTGSNGGEAGAVGGSEPLADAVYPEAPRTIIRSLEPTQVPEHLFESGTYVRWGSPTDEGGISWDVVCPEDADGRRTTLRLKAAFQQGASGTTIAVDVSARNDSGAVVTGFAPVSDPMLEAICRLLVREHIDATMKARPFDYSKFTALLSRS